MESIWSIIWRYACYISLASTTHAYQGKHISPSQYKLKQNFVFDLVKQMSIMLFWL